MGTDGIPQLKQPPSPSHRGTAQEDIGLDPCVLDGLCADNLVNIHPQQLMDLILYAKPKWAYLPISAAHGYHIYGTNFLLHLGSPPVR